MMSMDSDIAAALTALSQQVQEGLKELKEHLEEQFGR